ncbi:murein biosynthesis integral membrane protein MurJ [Fictibacillus phosphorivorans]|uniref:murein biosynthesis integral membrane protein MurJ n=1 Tax=Fictibacillus phosphorivorans TaxID=1221500 RepID=UPI0035E942D0
MKILFKSTIILFGISLFSRIMGFIRDTLTAKTFGTSNFMDAFNIAQTIPVLIFGILGSALTTTLLPVFIEQQKTEQKVINFLNILVSNLIIILIVILGFCFYYTNQIVDIIAPGFSTEQKDFTILITKIGLPSIIFMTLTAISISYLQSNKKFYGPNLIGVVLSSIIICYLLIFEDNYGVKGLMVVTTIAYVAQFIFLIPSLINCKWKFNLNINYKNDTFIKTILLMTPVILGSTVDQINFMVDRFLASNLSEGSISAITYSSRLNGLITGLFASSLGILLFFENSKAVSNGDINLLKRQIRKSLDILLIICIPISLFIFINAETIVQMVFERGSFDSKSTYLTSSVLKYYSLGIPAIMARDLLIKSFYSLKNTRTPMLNGIFTVILNILLSVFLVEHLGLRGLAIASSISFFVTSISLYFYLNNIIKLNLTYYLLENIFKIIITLGIIAIIIMVIKNITYWDYNSYGIMSLEFIGIIFYFIILFNFKIKTVDEFKKRIF